MSEKPNPNEHVERLLELKEELQKLRSQIILPADSNENSDWAHPVIELAGLCGQILELLLPNSASVGEKYKPTYTLEDAMVSLIITMGQSGMLPPDYANFLFASVRGDIEQRNAFINRAESGIITSSKGAKIIKP